VPINHLIGGLTDIAELMAAADDTYHWSPELPSRSPHCGSWRWAIRSCTRNASYRPKP
jgi:hypothetical protein